MTETETKPRPKPKTEAEITRTRFAAGQLLTAAEFQREQKRGDKRFRSLSRLLGSGILEGLDVRAPDPADFTKLIVASGYAIDASGRELVLSQPGTVEAKPGIVCASWGEPQPVFAADIAPARVESTKQLPIIGEVEQVTLENIDHEPIGDRVPLALVAGDAKDGWTIVQMPCLPRISRATAVPTRIVGTSWVHAGTGPWPPWVDFSAPLRKPSEQLVEIQPNTRKSSVAPLRPHPVTLQPDGMRLLFESRPEAQPGDLVIVRLGCDFVLDRRGVPVAGTASGGPGGLFESWFRVEEARR